MTVTWNEAEIREEMRKLDEKTGLSGAALPIRFTKSIHTLGQFSSADGGSFCFSNYYFQNRDWPYECALNTIRHEYAHYLDHMKYGGHGHGKTWKWCCIEVGANPIRLYHPEEAVYFGKKHEKEKSVSSALDALSAGSVIRHPVFGVGSINMISGEGLNRSAVVSFESGAESKKILLTWIHKHCEVISDRAGLSTDQHS